MTGDKTGASTVNDNQKPYFTKSSDNMRLTAVVSFKLLLLSQYCDIGPSFVSHSL